MRCSVPAAFQNRFEAWLKKKKSTSERWPQETRRWVNTADRGKQLEPLWEEKILAGMYGCQSDIGKSCTERQHRGYKYRLWALAGHRILQRQAIIHVERVDISQCTCSCPPKCKRQRSTIELALRLQQMQMNFLIVLHSELFAWMTFSWLEKWISEGLYFFHLPSMLHGSNRASITRPGKEYCCFLGLWALCIIVTD